MATHCQLLIHKTRPVANGTYLSESCYFIDSVGLRYANPTYEMLTPDLPCRSD